MIAIFIDLFSDESPPPPPFYGLKILNYNHKKIKKPKNNLFFILKYRLFILVICIYVSSLTVKMYATRSKWLGSKQPGSKWDNAESSKQIYMKSLQLLLAR